MRNGVARLYAQLGGPSVLLIGIVGLLVGNDPLLGALNIDIAEDLIHLGTGGFLTYLGFGRVDDRTVRVLVGALAAVYLAVGVVSFVEPELFGLIPHEYSGLDNAIHLALGVLGLGAAAIGPDAGGIAVLGARRA